MSTAKDPGLDDAIDDIVSVEKWTALTKELLILEKDAVRKSANTQCR